MLQYSAITLYIWVNLFFFGMVFIGFLLESSDPKEKNKQFIRTCGVGLYLAWTLSILGNLPT